jgi:hypothetical protein
VQIPTLPTDNFHKFRALAGLWLVVGTIAGVGLALFRFQMTIYEIDLRRAKTVVALNAQRRNVTDLEARAAAVTSMRREFDRARSNATKAVDALGRSVDDIRKKLASRNVTEQSMEETHRLMSVSERELAELTRIHNEHKVRAADALALTASLRTAQTALERDAAEVVVMTRHHRTLLNGFGVVLVFGLAALGFGVFLALHGFRDWSEIQDTQDEYLRQQLVALRTPSREQANSAEASPVLPPSQG